MTVLAIGIGFSIPISMYSVVDSFADIGGQWQERPQITLYLQKNISDAQIKSLESTLSNDPRIAELQYISAEQGLKTFSEQYQFDEAISLLDENPLPNVLVIYPEDANQDGLIAGLTEEYAKIETVSSAQYDFEWLQKLSALTSFLKRAVVVLASIIGAGLLLLIANTIRLEISIRKDEIDIIDQLGGTPAFISRPFLYMGLLEGVFGGIAAILISAVVLTLFSGPLLKLADLYGIRFSLPVWESHTALAVVLFSGLLGWLSAKFIVVQHLRLLQPK